MDFEFEKAGTVASLDGVPEVFRGLYQQGEGGFVLAETFAPVARAIDGLNRSLKAARRDVDTVKKSMPDVSQYAAIGQMLGLQGDDAANAEAIRAAVETTIKQSKDGQVNWEKMRQNLEQGFAQKLTAKDQELAKKDQTLVKYLVNSEATRAIAAAKGVPELLLPQIRAQTKVVQDGDEYVVRVVDAAGDPRGDGQGGFMTVEGLVKELKASPVFGRAFESEANSGNGARPQASSATKTVQRGPGELSPTDKIKAGLAARRS